MLRGKHIVKALAHPGPTQGKWTVATAIVQVTSARTQRIPSTMSSITGEAGGRPVGCGRSRVSKR